MKLKFVNPHNVRHQIPSWAIDPFILAKEMDKLLTQYTGGRSLQWDDRHRFWFDAKHDGDNWFFRLAEPDEGDQTDFCGVLFIDHPDWSISVPLHELLKGAPSLDGTHSLYVHGFGGDVPLNYFGITKQRWFDRLAQHESSARCGSPYLFHRALRDKPSEKIAHRVLLTALNYESAMGLEESWVEEFSLYPLGLNMVPGGFAGMKYLHSLGAHAKSFETRDQAIAELSTREFVNGRPNPLCASRWASDQDYANRVICGHSGRLTVDQVRSIRMLSIGGANDIRVSQLTGQALDLVRRVTSGKRYGRVA